jgi:hypothetical protein
MTSVLLLLLLPPPPGSHVPTPGLLLHMSHPSPQPQQKNKTFSKLICPEWFPLKKLKN